MEKELASVLRSAMHYEVRVCIFCCVLLAICMVGILCALLIRKKRKTPTIGKVFACAAIVVFVIVGILFIAQVNKQSVKIQNDIAQSQYVTYKGTFVHDDYQKDSFYHNVYIVDNLGRSFLLRLPDYANMYGTHSNYQEMPIGERSGTLIYSKESRLVVQWYIAE